MFESLIPGAVWRAVDFVGRRLNLRFGRAWDVRVEIRRAGDRARETERLWKATRREVEAMLDQFPLRARRETESETRLVVSVRFRDAPDDGKGE